MAPAPPARAEGPAAGAERLNEALKAHKPEPELLSHLNDAIEQLAAIHQQIGNIYIYVKVGNLDRALHHSRESIRYYEAAGDLYGAARTRHNVAAVLALRRRFDDAREYALSALCNFRDYANAAEDVQKTLDLIAVIDKDASAAPA